MYLGASLRESGHVMTARCLDQPDTQEQGSDGDQLNADFGQLMPPGSNHCRKITLNFSTLSPFNSCDRRKCSSLDRQNQEEKSILIYMMVVHVLILGCSI